MKIKKAKPVRTITLTEREALLVLKALDEGFAVICEFTKGHARLVSNDRALRILWPKLWALGDNERKTGKRKGKR